MKKLTLRIEIETVFDADNNVSSVEIKCTNACHRKVEEILNRIQDEVLNEYTSREILQDISYLASPTEIAVTGNFDEDGA